MSELYLIKTGEIALKGDNRPYFEKKLRENIKNKLKNYHPKVRGADGRYFLNAPTCADSVIREALLKTPGIVAFTKAQTVGKTYDVILAESLRIVDEIIKSGAGNTFKVDARRADKSFPMLSNDINRDIGSEILNHFPQLKVDVHNPAWKLRIEIRDKTYIYGSEEKACGGLPSGTAGRGTLLLSGGIDSPVAGYMMTRRGLKLDAVYFHAYPYTSDLAKQKVIDLASIIAPYCDGINLLVVPFTDVQMKIKQKARQDETTIMMRCCMMEIAEKISIQRGNNCMVTGEALSQVASQTAESLRVTGSHATLSVMRPCIGMDKEDIITIAKKIGTYDTSILPYEDCCVLFSPEHPLVRPNFEEMKKSYALLEIQDLLDEAINNTEVFYLKKEY